MRISITGHAASAYTPFYRGSWRQPVQGTRVRNRITKVATLPACKVSVFSPCFQPPSPHSLIRLLLISNKFVYVQTHSSLIYYRQLWAIASSRDARLRLQPTRPKQSTFPSEASCLAKHEKILSSRSLPFWSNRVIYQYKMARVRPKTGLRGPNRTFFMLSAIHAQRTEIHDTFNKSLLRTQDTKKLRGINNEL